MCILLYAILSVTCFKLQSVFLCGRSFIQVWMLDEFDVIDLQAAGVECIICLQTLSNDWQTDCHQAILFMENQMAHADVLRQLASRMGSVWSWDALENIADEAIQVFMAKCHILDHVCPDSIILKSHTQVFAYALATL